MNVEEAAGYLRRSRRGMYELLPYLREGDHYHRPRVGKRRGKPLFVRAALDRWLRESPSYRPVRGTGTKVNRALLERIRGAR